MKSLLLKFLTLALIAIIITSCCCPKDPAPNGIISKETALDMSNLYIANQYMFINENIPGEDNLSVNFSLKDLEDYICLVKKEAGKDYENLGLQIHFGAKNEEIEGVSVPRTTVFFAPTSSDGTSICSIPNTSILNMGDSGNTSFGSNPCVETNP